MNDSDLIMVMVINIQTGECVGYDAFATDPTLTKKRRLNSLGEDVHLFPDGSVKRDEDSIIATQRIWRERAYRPVTGVMYLKGLARFNAAVSPGQDRIFLYTS